MHTFASIITDFARATAGLAEQSESAASPVCCNQPENMVFPRAQHNPASIPAENFASLDDPMHDVQVCFALK